MCEPTTIMALTAAATATSAYSQYQQGQYQSKVAKNNAIIQQRMAAYALSRGERAENEHRLRVAIMADRQKAELAAGGREISGSAYDVLQDTAAMGELDALTIRQNAANEAWGYEVQGMNYLAQGKMDKRAGITGAAGTILSGGAKVGQQRLQYTAA